MLQVLLGCHERASDTQRKIDDMTLTLFLSFLSLMESGRWFLISWQRHHALDVRSDSDLPTRLCSGLLTAVPVLRLFRNRHPEFCFLLQAYARRTVR